MNGNRYDGYVSRSQHLFITYWVAFIGLAVGFVTGFATEYWLHRASHVEKSVSVYENPLHYTQTDFDKITALP